MVDVVRADGFLEAHHRFQRHERASRRLEAELLQVVGLLLISRGELEEHLVLRSRSIDGAGPSGAESDVECRRYLTRVEPDGRALVTIDDQIHTRTLDL